MRYHQLPRPGRSVIVVAPTEPNQRSLLESEGPSERVTSHRGRAGDSGASQESTTRPPSVTVLRGAIDEMVGTSGTTGMTAARIAKATAADTAAADTTVAPRPS